jgi:hypothetical protein
MWIPMTQIYVNIWIFKIMILNFLIIGICFEIKWIIYKTSTTNTWRLYNKINKNNK